MHRSEEDVAELRAVFPTDAFASEAMKAPILPEAWEAKRVLLGDVRMPVLICYLNRKHPIFFFGFFRELQVF